MESLMTFLNIVIYRFKIFSSEKQYVKFKRWLILLSLGILNIKDEKDFHF